MQSQVIEAEIVNGKELIANSNAKNVNELVKDDKTFWLTESERYALDYFNKTFQKGGASTYPLAPTVQAQLFGLYLQGRSLGEIRQLNHPAFSLGQIVHAAIEGDWYRQKLEYQGNLLQAAKERLQQIGCESVQFLADSLAAAHKQHGEALQKYLQSGNAADLGAFGIGSIRQYKEVAELILKMTGQDKTSTLNVKGEVKCTTSPPVSQSEPDRPLSLKELAERKKSLELEEQKSRRKKE
jgi:hypothetical protein